jgi:hypothetical protein
MVKRTRLVRPRILATELAEKQLVPARRFLSWCDRLLTAVDQKISRSGYEIYTPPRYKSDAAPTNTVAMRRGLGCRTYWSAAME